MQINIHKDKRRVGREKGKREGGETEKMRVLLGEITKKVQAPKSE